jgi:four helix bundle protein
MSTQERLRDRTKQFAFRIIRLFKSLPRSTEALVIGKQLLRSGTSVAANYRAVNRARSRAEFVAKIGVVLEEADEAVFWLEALGEAGVVKPTLLEPLLKEANELVAIFAASQRTARSNSSRRPDDPMTRSPDDPI